MATVPPETRADIARRRLAELSAAFDAAAPDPDRPPPGRRRRPPRRRGLQAIHLRLVTVLMVAAVVLVAWWLMTGRPQEVGSRVVDAAASAAPAGADPGRVSGSTASPGSDLVIDVAGAVRRPGIVTLPAGSRVHEAITAAGGLAGTVDTSGLNLARVLNDGEQVLVGAEAAGAAAAGAPADGRVNLNTADVVALDTLPGVGPVTAEAIVDWRDQNGSFRSVEDLLDVKGIGEATMADLRDRVTL